MPSFPTSHGERVDSVADNAGTSYGEFISVIKSDYQLLQVRSHVK